MTHPVRIPADIQVEDRVLGPCTARQVVIGAATAAAVYGVWLALGRVWPLPVIALVCLPVLAVGFGVAVGRRDGLPLEQWLVATARHHLAAPVHMAGDARPGSDVDGLRWRAGPRRPPAERVRAGASGVGLVDLGPGGVALVAAASTINLRLRTATEQDGLVAGFTRYLHSLTAGVQILVRAQPLDLRAHIDQLLAAAQVLPHPALAAAAAAHADDLAALTATHPGDRRNLTDREESDMRDNPPTADPEIAEWVDGDDGDASLAGGGLLTRQVLVVWREPRRRGDPSGMRAVEQRLLRRCGDAEALLAPVGITLTALDPAAAAELLTRCHALAPPPELPPHHAQTIDDGHPRPRPATRAAVTSHPDSDPTTPWAWPGPTDLDPHPWAPGPAADAAAAASAGVGTGWEGWDRAGWPTGDDVDASEWPTQPLHLPDTDGVQRRWPV